MGPTARERIRTARQTNGLSLRELARRVGVSASLLSQIENGRSDPSVSTLYSLVAELGLSLDALLDPGQQAAPEVEAVVGGEPTPVERSVTEVASGPVVHPGERRVLHMDSGVVWERLTRGPSDIVDALLVTYEPDGTSSSTGKLMRHSGMEFAYLLTGELTLQLGFETHVLRAGDSMEFDSSTPHLYYNSGDVPAKGLWYVVSRDTVPTQPQLRRDSPVLAAVGPRGQPPGAHVCGRGARGVQAALRLGCGASAPSAARCTPGGAIRRPCSCGAAG